MSRLSQSSGDTSTTSRSTSTSVSTPSTNRSNSTGLSVADLLQSTPEENTQPTYTKIPEKEKENHWQPSSHSFSNGKVPIPRQRTNTVSRHSRRVPRACEPCRLRKTKCSGDSPVCKLCRDTNATCVYPLAIREKTNRTISHLSRRLRECEDLLREVEAIVPNFMAKRIRALLEKEPEVPLNEASMNEESHHEGTVHSKSHSLSRFDSLESVEIGSQDISMTNFSGDGFTQQKIESTVSLDSTSLQERRVVRQDITASGYQFSDLPTRPISR